MPARDEGACREAWQAKRNERSPVRRPERALVTAVRDVKSQVVGDKPVTGSTPVRKQNHHCNRSAHSESNDRYDDEQVHLLPPLIWLQMGE